MLELGPYGSVRGARGNSRPYREPGPIAEVVGFKGERLKPSYHSVTPLDARRVPTFN
jgi:hypothetical protein